MSSFRNCVDDFYQKQPLSEVDDSFVDDISQSCRREDMKNTGAVVRLMTSSF